MEQKGLTKKFKKLYQNKQNISVATAEAPSYLRAKEFVHTGISPLMELDLHVFKQLVQNITLTIKPTNVQPQARKPQGSEMLIAVLSALMLCFVQPYSVQLKSKPVRALVAFSSILAQFAAANALICASSLLI